MEFLRHIAQREWHHLNLCNNYATKTCVPQLCPPCSLWKSESKCCSVMSDSLWPHGLHRPWNSPGQNTGVGSVQFSSIAQSCPTLCNPLDCSTQISLSSTTPRVCLNSCPLSQWCHPIISSSVIPTGEGSSSLLQRITQPRAELRSPALQVDSLPAEQPGSPRILEWVSYPFSSQSRNQTGVSRIAGRFFTSWPTREVLFSTAYKFTAFLLSHGYTFCSLEKWTVMTSSQRKPQSWPVHPHYIFKC